MNQSLVIENKGLNPRPIVAIHGSASNGRLWDGLAGRCAADRRVLTPDLQGYGKVDRKNLNPNATLAKRAAPILNSIRTLEQGIHLVAHSFGASIALEILRVVPEKVCSLTFYEPVMPALLRDSGEPGDMELLADLLALSDIVRGTTPRVGMETFVNFWSEPTAWERMPEATRCTLAALAPVVYQDFIEAYFNVIPNTFKQLKFKGPVALLLGERSNDHARRMADILLLQFPQGFSETFAGMGHMGPLTHPNEIHSRIMKLVERVEAYEPAELVSS
ncbi:MAG: alpha/beta hydrolase [Pseudomonadales bacterium]|nr:alpha/beta hydrolase [Pseudomonadales bacterium]